MQRGWDQDLLRERIDRSEPMGKFKVALYIIQSDVATIWCK